MDYIMISAGLILTSLSVFHMKAKALVPVKQKASRRHWARYFETTS